jgi:hypothetical protein
VAQLFAIPKEPNIEDGGLRHEKVAIKPGISTA